MSSPFDRVLLVPVLLLVVARFFFVCGNSVVSCHEVLNDTDQNRGGVLCPRCVELRQSAAKRVRTVLPSPHSELLLGTTLGINDLKSVPRFNDALVTTGTIHVVVVSGYNISLVFSHLVNIFKAKTSFAGFIAAQFGAAIYALITGLEAPVLRALIMVSAVLWAQRYGRKINPLRILALSVLLMLLYSPFYIVDLSFQLSFLATLGLVTLSTPIEAMASRYLGSNFFSSDLSASLSAQLYVIPLISYHFGRLNLISSLINGFVLWTIPLITILGFINLVFTYIHVFLGNITSVVFMLFSSIFVQIVYYFGENAWLDAPMQFTNLSVVVYYCLLFSLVIILHKVSSKSIG